jgi:uncharacterized membrane protein
MSFPEFSQLRAQAAHSLEQASNPKRMILFHSGMVLLLASVMTIVDYLLNQAISNTGGLGGMAARSLLSTIQSVVQIAQIVVLPFWQMGYTFYCLQVAQRKNTEYRSFLEGFRRFGVVLRLNLFTGIIYMAVAMFSTYVSSFLFMMSPWGASILEPLYHLSPEEAIDAEVVSQLIDTISQNAMLPIFCVFIPCFLLFCAPFFYRYRMAAFWLMDHPQGGALAAMHSSRQLMQGKRKALFQMDLRFWWFYLLDLLVTAICYGDLLLDVLGISLPFSSDAAYFLFFVLYLVCQLALYYWRRNEVTVSYDHVYLSLMEQKPEEPQKNPGKQPWVY